MNNKQPIKQLKSNCYCKLNLFRCRSYNHRFTRTSLHHAHAIFIVERKGQHQDNVFTQVALVCIPFLECALQLPYTSPNLNMKMRYKVASVISKGSKPSVLWASQTLRNYGRGTGYSNSRVRGPDPIACRILYA